MLSVASARLLAVPRPSIARRPLFGRLLDIRFAIAVATARQVSPCCPHLRRRRYSRWRACLPAPAGLPGELACQRLLAVAAASLPSQPSPPLRLSRPQLHLAGKHILLSSPPPPSIKSFCPANLAFCPPKCTFCPDPLFFCPALYVRKCSDISEDLWHLGLSDRSF